MSEQSAPVEVVLLWHHHQPDYRSPIEGRAWLPWVRLHATKDYLDMALRLERHPGVRAVFNFVPSLLDQLEDAARGESDQWFAQLERPIASLAPAERRELIARATVAPRHALERLPGYRTLGQRLARGGDGRENGGEPSDAELLALEVGFLLAWLDPMFLDEPEARAALAADGAYTVAHRDGLIALSWRLVAKVVPAYRRLAERGQIELTASPYHHPILPLLVDLQCARRARPDLPLPSERLAAPEDAARQIERGLERHARAFGARPRGLWPPEGGVSPEAVELAARAGIRWLASDEGVLWRSLPAGSARGLLYQPWSLGTPAGEVALLFRDRELSDRIGFVYQNWSAPEAAADFVARLRRIGVEHAAAARETGAPPLVTIALDGENCWEHYAEDGGPFLDALYAALASAGEIVTCTPSEVLSRRTTPARLETLHSGSWIDADFHIWIGHPEKNRAWDLVARARRALLEAGQGPAVAPAAWETFDAACASDWFWWFGDDHYTPDKTVFDRLFREHLIAAYERAGLAVPAWLRVPVARLGGRLAGFRPPIGFVRPTLDGRPTHFYEWHAAGRFDLEAGGAAMHRDQRRIRELYYGFDADRLYLRLDFADPAPASEGLDLVIEFLAPLPWRARVHGLGPGDHPVTARSGGGGEAGGEGPWSAVAGAECRVDTVIELALPFASLALVPGEAVELLLHVGPAGEPGETLPLDDLVRFTVPSRSFEAEMWSV